MTRLVLAPPAPPTLPCSDPDTAIGVHRIFCVGRNYAAHAREMGNDDREPPFFFMKPGSAAVASFATLAYPAATTDLHHEAELVVVIGRAGRDIDPGAALDHVWGYAAGNDLTRRDLQAEAKATRRPWDMAKGFDASAVIGPIHPVAQVGHLAAGRIGCSVDGAPRQDADLRDMTWSVPEIIAHLSRLVTLQPGDLIMTGTPEGVGAVGPGQSCVVSIEGLGDAGFRFA